MGSCACCEIPIIDTQSATGVIEFQYPRDALKKPSRAIMVAAEQLRDHCFLTTLILNLTFLDNCQHALQDGPQKTLLELAEALNTCHSLRQLEIHIYIPSPDHGGDPGGTIGAFLRALDRDALQSLTFTYRRMVFGFRSMPFHEFLVRHRSLKALTIGGSNTSWRLPELPSDLSEAICYLPCLTDLTVCAIGREDGSSSISELVKSVVLSTTCALQRLEMKRQHPSDWAASKNSRVWSLERKSLKWAVMVRLDAAQSPEGAISPSAADKYACLAVDTAQLSSRAAAYQTSQPRPIRPAATVTSSSHLPNGRRVPESPLVERNTAAEVSMSNVVGEITFSELPMRRGSVDLNAGKCFACLDAPREVTLLPCRHKMCCRDCLPRLEECPLCGETIRDSLCGLGVDGGSPDR
eukprot:EG_transcript_10256